MSISKNANKVYTAIGIVICAFLCAANFFLVKESSWDFYPQFFGATILTVDYSIFIVPVLIIISLFLKEKKRLILIGVSALWLIFAGLVMLTAIKNESTWESQKPKMIGKLATADEIKSAYDGKESTIMFITTVKESGRVDQESYFAYWDDLSLSARNERKTLYYLHEISENRNYLAETSELIKYVGITKLPAAIVIESDGGKKIFEGLDAAEPLTQQSNSSAKALLEYLN